MDKCYYNSSKVDPGQSDTRNDALRVVSNARRSLRWQRQGRVDKAVSSAVKEHPAPVDDAALATALQALGLDTTGDNFSVRTDSTPVTADVRAAADLLDGPTPVPVIDPQAMKGLKFSAALPPSLAAEVLVARLFDAPQAAQLARRPLLYRGDPVTAVRTRVVDSRWKSLTAELAKGPTRDFVDQLLPFGVFADLRTAYGAASPAIVVRGSVKAAGTLGGAFDYWVRLCAGPGAPMPLAFGGARRCHPALLAALDELSRQVAFVREGPPMVAARWVPPAVDVERALRTAWVLALFTEVYRAGPRVPNPLHTLAEEGISGPDDLLALAPEAGIEALDEMAALAQTRLLPHLRTRAAHGPTFLGPTFAGSKHMPADADLIVDGLLVELKTSPRHATPDHADLDRETVRQIVGYALHDWEDEYALAEVGLYQARFGYLATWPLEVLFSRENQPDKGISAARLEWKQFIDPA